MFSDFSHVLCYFECINTRRIISVVCAVARTVSEVSTLQWLKDIRNGRKCSVEVETIFRQMALGW